MTWMRKLEELNDVSGKIVGIVPNRIIVAGQDTRVWDIVEIGVPDYEEAVIARSFTPEQAIGIAFNVLNVKDQ